MSSENPLKLFGNFRGVDDTNISDDLKKKLVSAISFPPPNKGRFSCSGCNHSCRTWRELEHHFKHSRHEDDRHWECSLCESSFSTPTAAFGHFRTCTKIHNLGD